jgi:hypothetical protein
MNYSIIDKNTGEVKNIIIWDGVSDLLIQEDVEIVPCTEEHQIQWNNKQSQTASEDSEELILLQLLMNKYRDQIS